MHFQFDILDIFWFEVLRRHPELQLDAQGRKLPLPRNANINCCVTRNRNVPKSSTISDLCGAYEVLCSVDSVGNFDITEGLNLEHHGNVNVFQFEVARDLVVEDCVGPFVLSPLCCPRILSSQVLMSGTDMTRTEPRSFRHSRFVVAYLVLPELIVEEGAAVDPKKKKPAGGAAGGKGAPQSEPTKKIYYRILIVDVIGTALSGTAEFKAEVIHELLIDCESRVVVPFENANTKFDLGSSIDTWKEMFDGLQVDLSLDGALLSVVSTTFLGGCKVYSLALRDVGAEDVAVSRTAEETLPTDSGAPHHLERASLVAVVPGGSAALGGGRIQCATLLPPNTAMSGALTRFGSPLDQSRCRMLVTLRSSSKCLLYGFRAKSTEEVASLQQQAATAANAAVGKGAKGAAPPPESTHDIPALDVCLLFQWGLSDCVTAFGIDPHSRTLLALGSKDGTVELWDMDGVSLLDVLGRHRCSPITCLSVNKAMRHQLSSESRVEISVISGALDGTMCVFASYSSSTSHGSNLPVKVERGGHVRLSDYRFDAADGAVLDIRRVHQRSGELLPSDSSSQLTIVHYSSGLLAVYAIHSEGTAELIGRLEKRERVDYQFVYSSVHSWRGLPTFEDPVKKVAYLKAAEEAAAVAAQEAEAARLLAIQQAAVDAEKAEKAAAKAGKGKAAHVEVVQDVVVDPPVVDALPVVEPYQYVPQPEELREDQIDAIPYSQVLHAFADPDTGDSRRWQAFRGIIGIFGNSVVCSSERNGQPNLMLFSLSCLLGPTHGVTMKSSAETESNETQLAVLAAKSGDAKPAQHLRLTEERLLALESSILPPTTATSASKSNAQRLQQHQRLLASHASADPAVLMKASIARSRQEKQARKGMLLSNAATLASLFQAPVIQR